ncbi:MAG: hypothetical protein ABEJ44_07055 [Halanaeroarchaeum sp.]
MPVLDAVEQPFDVVDATPVAQGSATGVETSASVPIMKLVVSGNANFSIYRS